MADGSDPCPGQNEEYLSYETDQMTFIILNEVKDLKNESVKMKKTLYVILAAALCMLTSCKKEMTLAEKLVGDWNCHATSVDAEIYVTFTSEGTFALYQQIGEGAFRLYNGTYTLTGSVLSGQYNDGASWGTSYEVSATGTDTLTLTAEGVTETYGRVTGGIPEEVLAGCVTVVKSDGISEAPFL